MTNSEIIIGCNAHPLVRFTDHGRERAAEMGLRTKDIKRWFRESDVDYVQPKHGGRVRVCGEYAVGYKVLDNGEYLVMTVLFHIQEQYRRNGKSVDIVD